MERVPQIDLRSLDAATLAAVDRACREWGFFQLHGHGVEAGLRAELLAQMRAFFALPIRRKRAVERSERNVWGFYDRELTKNRRDWKEIFDVGPVERQGPLAGAEPQWPEDLPDFRPTLEAFVAACEGVAYRVLSALALCLGLEAEALHGCFGPAHTSFLRLNHYPPCPDPVPPDAPTTPESGELGIHQHTDAGALTVLLQDARPGLQVLQRGRWHSVDPDPEALLINIGDIVQVWSNDLYPAPLHRVIASARSARTSAAFFMNPSYETHYAPLSEPARYEPIHWGRFRAGRAAGDYADRGEEIQISQFRTGRSS